MYDDDFERDYVEHPENYVYEEGEFHRIWDEPPFEDDEWDIEPDLEQLEREATINFDFSLPILLNAVFFFENVVYILISEMDSTLLIDILERYYKNKHYNIVFLCRTSDIFQRLAQIKSLTRLKRTHLKTPNETMVILETLKF